MSRYKSNILQITREIQVIKYLFYIIKRNPNSMKYKPYKSSGENIFSYSIKIKKANIYY